VTSGQPSNFSEPGPPAERPDPAWRPSWHTLPLARAFRAQQKNPQRRHWQLLPLAAPATNSTVSSDKALLPLGALMLAVSVSGWAQSVTPVPAASGTAATTQSEGKSLAPVTVTGTRDRENQTYQSGITSVGKMPVPAKDIPQSLTVVNEKLMHDQGKDSFKSALENVIGITFEAGEGGRVGDNIRLRGFSAAGDIYTDGMRDIAQYNRDNFNTERVEVLRGAASMLFGRGSTGGIINQVSKQPRLITEHEVNATIGTKGYQRYQGDFNFKLDDDSAFRINAMATDGDGRGRKRQRIHPPPRPGHGLPLRHRHGQRI
jgi:catecholate siderophore receptor